MLHSVFFIEIRRNIIYWQGDIIRTHTEIPVNPIRPKEGDAHPLGALPIGTSICQVEAWPGEGAYYMVKAEEEAKIIKKVDNRVVVKVFDLRRKLILLIKWLLILIIEIKWRLILIPN